MTILNKTEEVLTQLRAENKIIIMDSPSDMALISEISKHMENVVKDYEIKDRNSQLSAASVVLTS